MFPAHEFNNEAALLQVLDHVNVIKLLMKHQEHGQDYLVFPLMKSSLRDELDSEEYCYSRNRTQQVLKMMLSGIIHIHSHDIVHRDLKPENILVDDSGTIKIADFGLSKQLRYSNETLIHLAGSNSYIAPEVHLKLGYSRKVDIWVCDWLVFCLNIDKLTKYLHY